MVYLVDLIETEDTRITNPGNYFGPDVNQFGVVVDNRDDETHTPETDAEFEKRRKKKKKQLDPNIGPASDKKEAVEESSKVDELLKDPEVQAFLTHLLKKSLSSKVITQESTIYEHYVHRLASFLLEEIGSPKEVQGVEKIKPEAEQELGQFPSDAVEKGIKVEMEHTTDREVAKKIALDHLKEDPHYYEKLDAVEGKPPYRDEMS